MATHDDGRFRRQLAVALASAGGLAYVLWRWRWRRKAAALPSAPCIKTHFLLGDFGHILLTVPRVPKTEDRPDLMALWSQAAEETRQEGMFTMTFMHWLLPFSRTMVIVHDLSLVRRILSKESWGLYKKGNSYHMATDLIGTRGLLASPDNDLWRWQRRILNPAFRRHLFDSALAPAVRQHVAAICDRWDAAALRAGGQRPSVDFYDCALRLTIDVLGAFAFGVEFGSSTAEEGQPLHAAFAVVLHRMTSFGRNPLLFLTRRLPTRQNRRYWEALQAIDRAVMGLIDRATAAAEGAPGEAADAENLLGQILRAAREDGAVMDRGLILENLKTFLFAGHDTTASALSWAVHLLATHPDQEAALLEELRTLGDEPTCDELEALPYLEAVVKETLRLYPSAGFTREPVDDIDLGGYTLPRGTEVFIFPYLIQRNEQYFERAGEFRPERWLTGVPTVGWLPFSMGARNCIGMQLAKLEIKLALHALLRRCRFEAVEDRDGPPRVVLYMTLVPNEVPLVPHARKF